MVRSPRRLVARNPLKIALIAITALAAIGGGVFAWYQQLLQQQAAEAAAALGATSSAVQATSQVATTTAQAAERAMASTATAVATDIERRYQAAAAFQQAGDNERARGAFQELIALQPGYKDSAARLKQVSDQLADSYYQQGVAAANQQLWGEAVAAFDKSLAIDPGYKDTATRRAAAAKALNATATPRPATATPTTQSTAEPTAVSSVTASTSPPAANTAAPEATAGAQSGQDATAPVANTDSKNPTPADAASSKPAGDWAVRSYNTDDIGVVLVNGRLVAASTNGRNDSGWVKINDFLRAGQENEIAVASWNLACCGRSWGFGVRRNDTQVWGSEESPGGGEAGMSYVQRLRISADGRVELLPSDTAAPKPPPGKWYVRVQGIQDVGAVLVNGVPTALARDNSDSGWVEITGQLASSHDNIIGVVAWNFDGAYSYNFAIKHDETIVWGAQKSGGGQVGVVLSQPVQISAKGDVKQ